MSCVVDKDAKKYFHYDDVLTSASKMVKTTDNKGWGEGVKYSVGLGLVSNDVL